MDIQGIDASLDLHGYQITGIVTDDEQVALELETPNGPHVLRCQEAQLLTPAGALPQAQPDRWNRRIDSAIMLAGWALCLTLMDGTSLIVQTTALSFHPCSPLLTTS